MKRKIKKKPIIIIIFILALITLGIIYLIKTINYHKTYEYKLLQVGYSKEEVIKLNKLNDKTKDYLLTIEYNDEVISLMKEKYFIEKNLKKYLDYSKKNKKSLTDGVAIINVGSNNEWYTNTKKSHTSKEG